MPYIRPFLEDKYSWDHVTDLAVCGRGIDLNKFSPHWRCPKLREKLGVVSHESAFTGKEDMQKQEVLVNHPWFEARLENHKDDMTASGIAKGCGSREGGGNIGVTAARAP